MVRALLTVTWAILVAGALARVTHETKKISAKDFRLVDTPPLAELQPPLLNIVTLGHRGLYDALAYVWTLQVLVDPKVRDAGVDEVERAVRTVTRHHPQHETLYMLACFTFWKEFGRPDLCKGPLLDGMVALPSSWRLPLTMGYVAAYQIDMPGDAAIYYGIAASKPKAPAYFASLARKLAVKGGLSTEELTNTLRELIGDKAGANFTDLLETSKNLAPPTPPAPPPASGDSVAPPIETDDTPASPSSEVNQ